MPDPKVLEVTGLEDLEQWLDRAPAVTLRELKKAMERAVLLVQKDFAKYPPANSGPGRYSLVTQRPMGWYERGRGWWYPLMRRPTGPRGKGVGTIGAGRAGAAGGVAGYRLAKDRKGKRGTSEVLGKSWATEVRVDETGVVGVLGNDTSYLDYVQGDRQARLHRAHDWQTIAQVLDADEERVIDEFEAAISRIVDTFTGSNANGQG